MRFVLLRCALAFALACVVVATEAQAPAPVAPARAGSEAAPAASVSPPSTGTVPESPRSSTRTEAVAPTSGADAGTYAVRLRNLEQRIDELQEQVFRSKGRLALLAETVLEGTVGGAELLIRHENRMSGTFELTRVVYLLDGAQIFPTGDSLTGEALAEAEAFDIYRGSIVPGEHTLSITLEYRGNGRGVFSYLEGYRFTVRSSHSFTAPEGRALTLRVVGLESGGQTTRIEDRPTVRYVEDITDELAPEAGEPD